MKKYILPFAMLLSLTWSACGNTSSQQTAATLEDPEPIQSGKIKITVDGKVFTFKLAVSILKKRLR